MSSDYISRRIMDLYHDRLTLKMKRIHEKLNVLKIRDVTINGTINDILSRLAVIDEWITLALEEHPCLKCAAART